MKTIPKRRLTCATYQAIAMSSILLLAACDSRNPAENNTNVQIHGDDDVLAAAIRGIEPELIIKAIEESPDLYPYEYAVVNYVRSGTHAERLGMTPGALLLKRADIVLTRFNNVKDDGELIWLDMAGKPHRDHVEGICGYLASGARDFTPWYISRGNRNPDWDLEVAAALVVHQKNPEMAKQLWERVDKKGYPSDCLSNFCRMNIACTLGESDAAASFAKAFGPLVDAPTDLPHWEKDWQQLSAVTGDYSWMANAAEFFYKMHPESEAIRKHEDVLNIQEIASEEADGETSATPLELAKRMQRSSILSELETSAPWTKNSRSAIPMHNEIYAAAKEAESLGKKDFEPKPIRQWRDTMHKSWSGPKEKVRDLEMTLKFTVKPIGGSSPSQYMREFYIGLANRTMHGGRNKAQVPPSARILAIAFGFNSSDVAGQSHISALVPSNMTWSKLSLRTDPFQLPGQSLFDQIPDHRPKPGTLHTLRVVRVGNQAEAILDGKRIALVHVPPHLDDTGVSWFVSGVEVEISSFHIDMLY